MKLPKFNYISPQSLKEASSFLLEKGDRALAIAGGTDLMLPLKERLKVPEFLVDLKGISDLNKLSFSKEEGLQIGPMLSLRHLAQSQEIKQFYPSLARAALDVAAAQIQSMGTVGGNICQDTLCLYYNRSAESRNGLELCYKAGGNICHTVKGSKDCWATFCSDLAPVLLVLDAEITIADTKGERIIPLNELYTGEGKRPNVLRPGQLITKIQVPPPTANSGSSYLKMRLRKTIDYPALGVAAGIFPSDEGIKAKIGLTGVEKRPLLLEDMSPSGKIDGEVIERLADQAYSLAHPMNNLRDYTPGYRKAMVKVYVKSAMEQALRMAGQ